MKTKMLAKKLLSSTLLVATVTMMGTAPMQIAHAAYADNRPTYFQRNPYVKKAAIGAGIGAGAGLILGHGASGVLKGAAIGTGAGLGYEYLHRKGVFHKIFN